MAMLDTNQMKPSKDVKRKLDDDDNLFICTIPRHSLGSTYDLKERRIESMYDALSII